MRRRVPAVATATILSVFGLLAALALSPAAEAHEVTGLVASCNLNIRNVPVITFAARFKDFTDADDHRHVWASVDGDTKINKDLFFDSSDYLWAQDVASTPGTHEVAVLITWMHYDDRFNASMSKKVVCPAPKPPPAPPVPPPCMTCSPVPPPPSPPGTKTVRKPVVVTTTVKNTDPPRGGMAVAARAHRYRLVTSWNPRRPSGVVHTPTWVTFHVRGPHDLSGVRRWFIDGHRLHASRWVTLRKRSATVALFDLAAWAPGMGSGQAAWAQLYGWHKVTYTAHRKIRVRVG